jgi:hypothetical protein
MEWTALALKCGKFMRIFPIYIARLSENRGHRAKKQAVDRV